jgi:N-acyl-D-aspartate/D-glutamate deacylase
VLITPGEQCSYADVYDWQPRIGRPFTYPMFASPGGKHLEALRLHEQGVPAGAQVWPQVTPRPLTMQFTLADPYSLNTGKVFGELLQGDRAARIAAYRDPAWRERAAADLEQSPMKPRWETFAVSESARHPELEGRRVTELAAARDASPLDVMCELAVEEDLKTRFRAFIANDDVDAVGHLLTHEQVALGLSDAGAHVDQLCDAPLPTDLLGTWVRERGVMPLERAVRKLTGEPADLFGFAGRGYLREGYAADVCVFDPRTIGTGPTRRVRDFPADAERLTAEEPTGLRHVLVNGTPIRVDERQLTDPALRPGTHPTIT